MVEQNGSPAETRRYAIRIQPDFEWTIYDVFTGHVAQPSNWPLIDVPLDKGEEYCHLLNSIDQVRRSFRR